eukprot:RCo049102
MGIALQAVALVAVLVIALVSYLQLRKSEVGLNATDMAPLHVPPESPSSPDPFAEPRPLVGVGLRELHSEPSNDSCARALNVWRQSYAVRHAEILRGSRP